MRFKRFAGFALVLFVLAFIASSGISAANVSQKPHHIASRGLIWKVTSKTTTAYLFGSIHYAKKSMYPLSDAVEAAFDRSKVLVVEVNTEALDQAQVQAEVKKRGIYPEGQTIVDHIDKDILVSLKKYLSKNQIPFANVLKFKPGLLSITLVNLELIKLGYLPEEAMDIYFMKKAIHHKPIKELETLSEQFDVIFNMPDTNTFMKQTLVDLKQIQSFMDATISAWSRGDAKSLYKTLILEPLQENPEIYPIYKRIFFDRNKKMVKKIEHYLTTGKTHFIVVGAGHLIGDKGIVQILEKQGYKIKQL